MWRAEPRPLVGAQSQPRGSQATGTGTGGLERWGRADLPPSFKLSPSLWVKAPISRGPQGKGGQRGRTGWGLTWKVRQFPLLILQSGHVIARVLPLILGAGERGPARVLPPSHP